MSLTDTDPTESEASALGPDYTFREFVEHLAKWPARDTIKIALLQITVAAAGRRGQLIDHAQLAELLERTPQTVGGVLKDLKDEGWVKKRHGTDPETERAVPQWYTAREVAG